MSASEIELAVAAPETLAEAPAVVAEEQQPAPPEHKEKEKEKEKEEVELAEQPAAEPHKDKGKEKEKEIHPAAAAAASGPSSSGQTLQNTPFYILWVSQLFVLLKTQAILTFIRNWKSFVVTVLSPIAFLLLLYLIQYAAAALGIAENLHPKPYDIAPLPACTPGKALKVCVTVMFAPDTPETRLIMSTFNRNNRDRLNLDDTFDVVALQSPNDDLPKESHFYAAVPEIHLLTDFAAARPNLTQYGVSFDRSGNNFRYQVWFNKTLATNVTQSISESYGFQLLSLFRGLDEAILEVASKEVGYTPMKLSGKVKDFPTKASSGISVTIFRQAGPLFFFCSAMINFLLILNTVITEKEYKLRHGMQMMGLIPSVYWTSWFLINTVIVLLASLVTCLFGLAFQFTLFTTCNFGVVFLLFFLFSEAMILFAFFITTFISRVRVGTLVGVFILIIGLVFMLAVFSSPFVGYIWWEQGTGAGGWIVLMFIPFFNFGKLYLDISLLTIGTYDFRTDTLNPGPGFLWEDLYNPVPQKFLPSIGTYNLPPPVQSLNLLIMNVFFYAFLTWIFDNVIPDEFGNSRPIYFPFMPSYWGLRLFKKKVKLDLSALIQSAQAEVEDEDVHTERLKALDNAQSEDLAVRLLDLRKVYPNGWFSKEGKVAVAGSSWTLEEGKLLALLGQNGAGKSTTINMLCGFSKASAGDGYIFGCSVRTQMSEIRAMMGVCPQHDILFNNLTAQEHIELFAGIKNIPKGQIAKLVEDRLSAVRLYKVRGKMAGTYSGGMKRRLSVALSTIGDPKIVFMDEPTTGMDPVNRRHVWSFIEKFKKGRAIILTTHSMEEADILGDSIAIMALGRLRAFGSAIRLRGKFAAGYRISLVTEDGQSEQVQKTVQERVAGSVLEDNSAGAIIFKLPPESLKSVAELIRDLEDKKIVGVREWGISQSTLEDVFLKIIREVNPTNTKPAS